MAQPFALQALLDVAISEAESAAASLGDLNRKLQLQEQQLKLLLQYRADYQERLRCTISKGLDSTGLRNFNEFMERLEVAIRQQQAAVGDARERAREGLDHWQAKQRKSKAFDTLSQRFTASAMRGETSREQKLQDDFASRTTRYRLLAGS